MTFEIPSGRCRNGAFLAVSLKKGPKGRIIKKERDYDAVRKRESERKDFEEGRKVRMQMTFIFSTVTLNP
jgi:hypothetical protein